MFSSPKVWCPETRSDIHQEAVAAIIAKEKKFSLFENFLINDVSKALYKFPPSEIKDSLLKKILTSINYLNDLGGVLADLENDQFDALWSYTNKEILLALGAALEEFYEISGIQQTMILEKYIHALCHFFDIAHLITLQMQSLCNHQLNFGTLLEEIIAKNIFSKIFLSKETCTEKEIFDYLACLEKLSEDAKNEWNEWVKKYRLDKALYLNEKMNPKNISQMICQKMEEVKEGIAISHRGKNTDEPVYHAKSRLSFASQLSRLSHEELSGKRNSFLRPGSM